LTTGRRLVDGEPVGEGFTVDADGPTAEKLHGTKGPLVSNPVTGEWLGSLVTADETDGEYVRTLGVFAAGNEGPRKHYHTDTEESFKVIEGELLFEIDSESILVKEGESVVVEPGTPHKFSNPSESASSCLMEAEPVGKIAYVVLTHFGLGHEGKLDDDGAPNPLQGAVIASELSDDTVFTSPPPAIQRATAKALAPVGKLLGHRAVYPRYESDTFWEEHVEQPDL